ncbi:Pectinesterase domain-containing protein [Fusarium falciforme]|uniref:Pectinesterase domain-containing protein n=1 Tax=Fusarium falciforme TaxID=195108 RepID=UPI002301A6F8|nr:Pectinesterase domain-containing protein [Fusarium falciforme]WAO94416.1 Pectinesterase domain-containing protein [Fusarium falciforme]
MMTPIFKALLVAQALFHTVATHHSKGPVDTYKKCQRQTHRPTEGCPPGTLYVARDDARAHFNSVQDAIDSFGNTTTPGYILIAPGNYTEQLNVTRRAPLHLIGMSNKPWKHELYADIDVNTTAQNDVQIWWNSANHNASFPDNVYTGVLTIGPNLNATLTGSGPTGFPVPVDTPFGCTDFRAYNIDFRNEYIPYSYGPAHALGVSRANAGFYSCGFYSYQDTVYVGKLGNAFFYDSVIAGQTDFLYGFGTAYIDRSTLSLRSCGGGITAWKGTNTTFTNKYGVYINDAQVIAANSTVAKDVVGKCALGRPWNSQHRSIFMKSYFDTSINPAGYIIWGKDTPHFDTYTFMASWKNYGPGYDEKAEAESNVTLVLTDTEVAPYRLPVDIFQTPDGKFGNVHWIDRKSL